MSTAAGPDLLNEPHSAALLYWALLYWARDLIVVVNQHDPGPVARDLVLVEVAKGHYDQEISRLDQVSRRAVDAYQIVSPGNGVGLEPSPVVHVEDGNLLELTDIGRPQQVGRQRDRAFVVDVGSIQANPVELGPEQPPAH
jgi:hypothetical protein